jgi:hypothetical protein
MKDTDEMIAQEFSSAGGEVKQRIGACSDQLENT